MLEQMIAGNGFPKVVVENDHCRVFQIHGVGHDVGGLDADVAAVFHHVHDLAEHALGEPLPHHIGAEYIGTEDLCDIDAHRFNPFHTVWSDRPARGD